MSVVIKVDSLSKKYILSHQAAGRYVALRDVITNGAKNIGRRLIHPRLNKPVSITREDFWALKDVSLEINLGDRVGIIGRNGAGKSTLLKVLSRIIEPTSGRVSLKGRVASLLEVGTGFHPELTGRENIYLNGAILGMHKAEIEKKFDEIVAFSEVEKFLDTPVKHFSSGMYVRLAFSVAAHLEPEILIVDEVLAVGDAAFQKKCLGKMNDVARQGRTILFVSHNMAAVNSLCTRAVLLVRGQKAVDGQPEKTIQCYLEDYKQNTRHKESLLQLPRESDNYGHLLKLARVSVIDANGAETVSIESGRKFTIVLEFFCFENVADISIIVGIDTAVGIQLVTVGSEEAGIFYSFAKGQTAKVRVHFNDLYLKAGQYIVRAGVRKGLAALDLVRQAQTLEVVDYSQSRQSFEGLIRSNPAWEAC